MVVSTEPAPTAMVASSPAGYVSSGEVFECGNVYYRPYMSGSQIVYGVVPGPKETCGSTTLARNPRLTFSNLAMGGLRFEFISEKVRRITRLKVSDAIGTKQWLIGIGLFVIGWLCPSAVAEATVGRPATRVSYTDALGAGVTLNAGGLSTGSGSGAIGRTVGTKCAPTDSRISCHHEGS